MQAHYVHKVLRVERFAYQKINSIENIVNSKLCECLANKNAKKNAELIQIHKSKWMNASAPMVFCFFYYYFIRATCIDFVIFCFLLAYLAFGWTGRIHRMHNAYTYIRILHTFQTDSVSLCPSLSLFVVPLILFFSFIRSNAKFCCFHTQDFWINLAQKMTEGPWLKCLLKWTVCSGCSRSMKKMHLKSNCVHNFRPVEKKIYQGLMYRCKICLRPPVSPNNFFFDFFCSRLARYCVFNEKKKKKL